MKKIIFNNYQIIKYITNISPCLLILIVISSLVRSALSILGIISIKIIVDIISINGKFNRIISIITLFFILNILLLTIRTYIEQRLIPINTENISGEMRKIIFRKTVILDLECYENTKYYDNLTIAHEEAKTRIIGIIETLSILTTSIFSIVALITFITTIKPFIIILSLISVLLSFIANTIMVKYKHNFYKERVPLDRMMSYIQKVGSELEFAMELRLYSKFPSLLMKKFSCQINTVVKLIDKYSRKYVRIIISQNAVGQIINIGIVLYLSKQATDGILTIGAFISLINGSQQLSSQIISLVDIIPKFYEHGIYFGKFLEFLNYKPSIYNKHITTAPRSRGEIEFKNVYFKYFDSNGYALKNVSFKIKYGEKIAIVGRNGAGKSTLVKLLNRLYDPEQGTIYLNKVPYQEIDLNLLRNYFGTLIQNFQIFSVSLAENVLMEEISCKSDEKKINEALKFVGLKNKILELDNGIFSELNREFSEKGILLSGGEYQKIALARTFVKNSQIIILDEPSSSLDPISEKQLFDKMMELVGNKTLILISHKLSNVANVDKIFYIEDGEIKECGSHFELMEKGGLYAEMYNIQAQKYNKL